MTAKHKGGLVVILAFGFLLSLPLMLTSTNEEKQHLVQNTPQMHPVQQHVGLENISNHERTTIQADLDQEAPLTTEATAQDIWIKQVLPRIQQFDTSEHEAKSIAKWVWIYAQSHDIDPALILALITVESRFDPFATSLVGAQGLMQVMPFWKRELGSPEDDLFNIATNIRYGCAILKHYIQRYHTVEKALAAYNGSKGRVKYPNKIFAEIKNYQFSTQ
ncbi:MAG: lytic transglycosylase domain-containing protein [Ghiorsea sp.]|nr:lytic transglycosylase domain-containing protein [Ghiorsea sp.]